MKTIMILPDWSLFWKPDQTDWSILRTFFDYEIPYYDYHLYITEGGWIGVGGREGVYR